MTLQNYIKLKENEALEKGLEKEGIKTLLTELEYKTYTNLISNYQTQIDTDRWDIIISKYLDKKIPIQYILNYSYFYGLKLIVNTNTLIPRPETELIVDEALKIIKEKNLKTTKVIDVGTGSGAIAIAIAFSNSNSISIDENINIEMTATDISEKALEVAKVNAKNYKQNIDFKLSNCLECFLHDSNTKFDIIVSNPPYIKTNEYVQDIVYKNEPHLALYGGEDGLYFYKKIIEESTSVLNKDGVIIFEIGHTQGKDILSLAKEKYPASTVIIKKDYNNLDRIVIIKRGE